MAIGEVNLCKWVIQMGGLDVSDEVRGQDFDEISSSKRDLHLIFDVVFESLKLLYSIANGANVRCRLFLIKTPSPKCIGELFV